MDIYCIFCSARRKKTGSHASQMWKPDAPIRGNVLIVNQFPNLLIPIKLVQKGLMLSGTIIIADKIPNRQEN
jgi:hypothetical protein